MEETLISRDRNISDGCIEKKKFRNPESFANGFVMREMCFVGNVSNDRGKCF